jgi:hypothetical protein
MKAQATNLKVLIAWVIYDHPTDYPNHFVVRRWEGSQPDQGCQLYETLEEAREAIPPGLCCFVGDPDPKILETYI